MTIYYDKENKCFYDSEINETMPNGAIEITSEQHNTLLEAINDGCIIFDDLTYSEPKPSRFHSWDDDKWIENTDAKQIFIQEQSQSQKISLLAEADKKIAILQDAIDLGMEEENDADKLKLWKRYRVLLYRTDPSIENMMLPKKPI